MYYLEVKDIIKQYGDHTALNGVSLQVPRGCIYGLLGPNGAGKSTLIRIINRISIPDGGEVLINGKPSTNEIIYNIGYLPEERGLYKKMKVEEHVIFLARLKGLSKQEARIRAHQWLTKFDILSWKDKKIEELSKGMQQKIQFITTVIHEPDLFILDEPFSGFDPVNAELLKNEILELKAKGKTIILSTHNMESVEALCDEITLINQSQVILQGDVKNVRNQYRQHILNVELVGDDFDVESDSFSVLGKNTKEGLTYVRLQKKEDISNSDILKEIAGKCEIMSFVEELPTMNDIFIQLVSKKEA